MKNVMKINDILDDEKGIIVDDVTYDTEVNVTVIRTEDGKIEISKTEVGTIFIIVAGAHFLLDQYYFKEGRRSLYCRLVEAIQQLAIDKAQKVKPEHWAITYNERKEAV